MNKNLLALIFVGILLVNLLNAAKTNPPIEEETDRLPPDNTAQMDNVDKKGWRHRMGHWRFGGVG